MDKPIPCPGKCLAAPVRHPGCLRPATSDNPEAASDPFPGNCRGDCRFCRGSWQPAEAVPFDLLLDEFHAFVNTGVQSFNSQGHASFRTSPAAGGKVNGFDIEEAFERIQFREDHPVGTQAIPTRAPIVFPRSSFLHIETASSTRELTFQARQDRYLQTRLSWPCKTAPWFACRACHDDTDISTGIEGIGSFQQDITGESLSRTDPGSTGRTCPLWKVTAWSALPVPERTGRP